jgi:hypothetical protein
LSGWTIVNALGALDDANHPVDDGDVTRIAVTSRIFADARRSGQAAVRRLNQRTEPILGLYA